MNRKGYVITIVTIILFLALALLAAGYAQRLKVNEEIYIKLALGEKIRVIEGDIGVDFFDFWPMQVVSIVKNAGAAKTIIDMRKIYNITGQYGPYYDDAIRNYATVVEGTYARKTNAIIKLLNITSGFVIMPWNQTFSYDPDNGNFFIYPDPANVNTSREYTITIYLNRKNSEQVSESHPTGSGQTTVDVSVKEMTGGHATIQNWNQQLDPYKTDYPAFNVTFNDGMSFKVYFGMYNGVPGVLRLIRNDPPCCTTNSTWPRPIEIDFDTFKEEFPFTNQTVYVASKDLLVIDVKIDELKKEGRIVLAQESG